MTDETRPEDTPLPDTPVEPETPPPAQSEKPDPAAESDTAPDSLPVRGDSTGAASGEGTTDDEDLDALETTEATENPYADGPTPLDTP